MLYFIVNETARSGKGRRIWNELAEVLAERNTPYKAWITRYEGHAGVLAAEICEKNDDDICMVVVGGDGTANEVINGITDFEKIRFGTIPIGSGNDLARGLGINGSPKENLIRILDAAKQRREDTQRMDLGQVSWNGGTSSRLFIISAGTGLDALVCKKALQSKMKVFLNRLHLGKLTYLFLTVQSLFTMRTADAAIRFLDQKEKQKNREKMIFAAAMNLPAEGGGVPMSPEADAFDGRLSVCQAWGIPKWRTFLCLPFLVAAKHANLKGFSIVDCKSCEVHLSEPMELHTDGECCGEVDEMRFDALPGKLRVLK